MTIRTPIWRWSRSGPTKRSWPASELETAGFLPDLSRLRVKTDHVPDDGQILRLARTLRLSIYDAAYLELAGREHLPLATLDAALAAAARAEGVRILGDPGRPRP